MPDAPAGERLVVALVRGLHGLRGGLRVEVLTDRPAERFAPGHVLVREGSEAPLTVVEASPAAPGWILRFAEVPSRDAAEAFRGAYLEAVVPRETVLGAGEFWWHEVIGCPVHDRHGEVLGTVRDVYRAGGAEVLVVAGPRGEFELPAARPFVLTLDPGGEGVVVDPATLDLEPPSASSPGPPGPEPG